MASGRRLRRAKIINLALEAAGITSGATVADNANLTDLSFYGKGGISPTITTGSTTVLADSASNSDYVWDILGYSGETDAYNSGFIRSSTVRRYIPLAGEADVTVSTVSSSVLLYSADGPLARFNQYYLPSANKINGTGSITFTSVISGAAGGLTKLRVYVAGAFPTASVGATLSIISGSTTLLTYTSSSIADPVNTTASFSSSFAAGISGSLPAVNDILKITLPAGYSGLTTSASYTIIVTSSLPVVTSSNTMYITTGSGGVNVTGSTFHTILRKGINAEAISLTSSFGDGFSNLYSYVSASDSTAGVSLYARNNGLYGRQIAVSGSSNKIKKIANSTYFQFEPYYQTVAFNAAGMSTLKIVYSSSANTATLNSFAPGVIVYITGSSF